MKMRIDEFPPLSNPSISIHMVQEGVMVFANSCGIWNKEGQEECTPTLIRKKKQGELLHKLEIIYDRGKICKYPFRASFHSNMSAMLASQNNLTSRDNKKLRS